MSLELLWPRLLTGVLVTFGVRQAALTLPTGSSAAVAREMRLLVIPARFTDSPAPPVSRAALQQEMFDGPSMSGTITEHFAESSGGRLVLTGDVHDWVQTPLPRSSWPGLGTEFLNGRMEFAAAAIRAADVTVDFRQYDNDGPDGVPNSGDDDGVVDAGVAVLWAERARMCSGDGELHAETIRFTTPDRVPVGVPTGDVGVSGAPILVAGAAFASSIDCNGNVRGNATLVHELGHLILRLADYYSQQGVFLPDFDLDRLNGRRWVLGCWDVMAAGSSWGCGAQAVYLDEPRPTLHGPRSRVLAGWLQYTDVPDVRDTVIVLAPAALDGAVLRILVRPGDYREYFLIEYRQRIGFDVALPASGVLIYSVDTTRLTGGGCNGTCRSYYQQIVEADGGAELLKTAIEGGDRGTAGDAFGVGDGTRRFGGNTTPRALRRDGSVSTLTIHDIVVDEANRVARIRLSTAPTPAFVRRDGMDTTLSAAAPGDVILRAAGGVLPYEWTADSLPAGKALHVFAGTDSAALRGAVSDTGRFSPRARVVDALGAVADLQLNWRVAPAAIATVALTRRLLEGPSNAELTLDELAHLDRIGNRNGVFDVGDVRAALRRR